MCCYLTLGNARHGVSARWDILSGLPPHRTQATRLASQLETGSETAHNPGPPALFAAPYRCGHLRCQLRFGQRVLEWEVEHWRILPNKALNRSKDEHAATLSSQPCHKVNVVFQASMNICEVALMSAHNYLVIPTAPATSRTKAFGRCGCPGGQCAAILENPCRPQQNH